MEILTLFTIIILYFLPSIIAFVRDHLNAIPILLTNLFFGWSLLGWILAFIWAFTSNVKEKPAP